MRITFLFALLITHCLALADTLTGRVVRVTDGDTIVVLDSANTQHKIRLTGIDAPEKKQAFGTKSKEHRSTHPMVMLGYSIPWSLYRIKLFERPGYKPGIPWLLAQCLHQLNRTS